MSNFVPKFRPYDEVCATIFCPEMVWRNLRKTFGKIENQENSKGRNRGSKKLFVGHTTLGHHELKKFLFVRSSSSQSLQPGQENEEHSNLLSKYLIFLMKKVQPRLKSSNDILSDIVFLVHKLQVATENVSEKSQIQWK